MDELPLIDISPLREQPADAADVAEVVQRIDAACRRHGFFLVTGHGIDEELFRRLQTAARRFFAQPDEVKAAIDMARAGRAWRGWFPLGNELTSGRPDRKEGLYFGSEDPLDHPRVRAGVPLHGPNLFPSTVPELRPVVLEWIAALNALGQDLLGGIALALGLDREWFRVHLTADPTVLFRIFHYPAAPVGTDESNDGWGVGEHTDYGLLTILAQESAGLQVHTPQGWIDVPAWDGAFVVNIGDMLDLMTAGRYRSTPHRVRSTAVDRLSFPFFFDPGWDAEVRPLPIAAEPAPAHARPRWDAADLRAVQGPYHQYLLSKVARVFPDLADEHTTAAGEPNPSSR